MQDLPGARLAETMTMAASAPPASPRMAAAGLLVRRGGSAR